MSTTGQWVGAIAGGVIGFFTLGGPMGAVKGAAYGAALGGYIDPPPGPNLRGPTLDDKSFQSSAYGVSLPRLYGTIATVGNIIYLENNEYKAVSKKESQGGKGGGGGTYETTTYFATFAVALAEAKPGSSVRRIWAGGKLIYSAGSDDLATIIQSEQSASSWKYYDGSQTQSDSRMEAVLGVGKCPTYEGTAYLIFYDFDLTTYGNGLAGCPIKVEILTAKHELATGQIRLIKYYDTPALEYSVGATGVFIGGKRFNFIPVLWPGFRDSARAYSGDLVTEKIIYRTEALPGSDLYTGQSTTVLGGINTQSDGWYTYLRGLTAEEEVYCAYSPSHGEMVFGYTQNMMNFQVGHVVHTHSGLGFSMEKRSFEDEKTAFGVYTASTFVMVEKLNYPAFGYAQSGSLFIVDPDSNEIGTTLRKIVIYQGTEPARTFFVELPYVNSEYPLVALGNTVYLFSPPSPAGVSFWVISLDAGAVVETGFVEFGLDSLITGGSGGRLPNWVFGSRDGLFCLAAPRENGGSRFVFFLLDPNVGGDGEDSVGPERLDELVASVFDTAGVEHFDVSALAGKFVNGYRVLGPASARGSLAQLQVAYLFDIVERGYTLTCVTRGRLPSVSVPHSSLISRGEGAVVNKDFEQDSRLPSRYRIEYLDYRREYDPNEQFADFPSRHENIRSEQLAIVMSGDSAAKLADVLGGLAWVEREQFALTVPQEYLQIQLADVIDVEVRPGVPRSLRIDSRVQTVDQMLQLTGRAVEPGVYVSSATGAPVTAPVQVIPYIGNSYAVLLDLPMLIAEQDKLGVVAAMYGDGKWPGGALLASSDGGQSFLSLEAFNGAGTLGASINTLPEHDGLVLDRGSELQVSMLSGELAGVTPEQMLTGKNYCAYGADGRWEIIQFANAEIVSPSVMVLSVFVRGLAGTEWASGLHQPGDYLVYLEDPDNKFLSLPAYALGMAQEFKAVTFGMDAASVDSSSLVFRGVSLKPLSVVHVEGIKTLESDFVVSFVARTRYGANFWVTGVQPVNEPVMKFEMDILSADVVVRTLSAEHPHFVYTAAQQIEDFGALQSAIHVRIFQISATVGRGFPREVIL